MTFTNLVRVAALAAVLATTANSAEAVARTPQETSALKSISAKLGAVQTMNGEFVQFGPTGERTEGKFFLARPGKVLFKYDPPTPISVIADGKSVLVHDTRLQTYDIWPLSKTPLKFLLDSTLDLASSERVGSITIEPDLIRVVVVDDSKFGGGKLTLFFDAATNELRQWTVTDEQGLETTVAIYNVEVGNKLSQKIFRIDYNAATNARREKNDR
jgi:outer membrane lipoprotein-sorting protein